MQDFAGAAVAVQPGENLHGGRQGVAFAAGQQADLLPLRAECLAEESFRTAGSHVNKVCGIAGTEIGEILAPDRENFAKGRLKGLDKGFIGGIDRHFPMQIGSKRIKTDHLRVRLTTFSTWVVWGNISTGWTKSISYRGAKIARSRACVAGLQLT